MSIISKETWDKFTQEEKDKLRSIYSEAKKVGTRNIRELEEYFGKENLQLQPLTYEDAAKMILSENSDTVIIELSTFSLQHERKLVALNKLLNVAKFLNKDWKPDWSEDEDKWSLCVDPDTNEVKTIKVYHSEINRYVVYFRTEELTKQAIQILGEDTVRLALTTEY